MKKIRSVRTFILFFLVFAFIFPNASLDAQVRPPIIINILSCTVIDAPGDYWIINNITGKDVPVCIEITSSNVRLNGRGFSVNGVSGTVGIKVYSPGVKLGNVTVENVNLNDWVTGIEFQDVDSSDILSNNFQNINGTGIRLIFSDGNNVSGNTVTSDTNYGTFVGISNNGSDNRIEHNTVSASAINGGNSFSSGIAVSSTDTGNIINGNNLSHIYTGITVGGSSHTISNNTLLNNIYGMRISSTILSINNNTISSIYNGDGIWTDYLTNSTITGNKITGSANNPNDEFTGIRMLCSAGNQIYNNLFDADNNAIVQPMNCFLSNSNTWNTVVQPGTNIVGGPNLGGNYWGSFSRNCQDSDGDYICDSSYNSLYIGNVDNYPLKEFPDPDGDGVPDPDDNCPSIPNPDQENSDTDGLGDACDNCWYTDNINQTDTNVNCLDMPFTVDPLCGDACEPSDTDSDGVIDDNDNCPLTSNPLQEDNDEDARGDACDNCVSISNPGQEDSDSDGTGNVCDNCWYVQNPDQSDADGDCSAYNQPYSNDPFCGSACEECPDDPGKRYLGRCGCGIDDAVADPDGDGVCGASDQCPNDPNKIEPGICGCGVSEIDDDNDGYLSCNDNCPDIRNDQTDTDSDGLGDVCDNCLDVSNANNQGDSDGDGVGDVCDNCPDNKNGQSPVRGVCTAGEIGEPCTLHIDCGPVGTCVLAPRGGTCVEGNIGIICGADGACGPGGVCSQNQEDADSDGAGDACDDDADNDLIPNHLDNCPFVPNSIDWGSCVDTSQGIRFCTRNSDCAGKGWYCDRQMLDRDGDGIGNACNDEYDTDGDEWADELDNCPSFYNSSQVDLNNDGVGDACIFDLSYSRIEFTQGIQDLNNSIPLIYGKDTWIRVYFDVGDAGEPLGPVTGTMSFYDSAGIPIPTYINGLFGDAQYLPVNSINSIIIPPNPNRADSKDSLNFLIPKNWRWNTFFGTPHIRIQVFNNDTLHSDINILNDSPIADFPLEFLETTIPKLLFAPIEYNGCTPVEGDFLNAMEYVKQTYPVSDVIHAGTLPISLIDYDPTLEGNRPVISNGERVQVKLVEWDFWNDFKDSAGVHYDYTNLVGVTCTRSQMQATGNTVGMGVFGEYPFGWVSWFSLNEDTDIGGARLAHELGHNLNRRHAPSFNTCGENPAHVDTSYPQYQDENGINLAEASIGEYGFDGTTVYNPNSTYDIMSYCSPVWVSPYTYNAFIDKLRLSPATSASGSANIMIQAQEEQEYMIAIGTITADNTVKLESFHRIMLPIGTSDEPGTGNYSIELQDQDGTVLFTRYFSGIQMANHQLLDKIVFVEKIPYAPDTRRIILKNGGKILANIAVSPNRPVVGVTYPNGGESLSGEQTITWTGTDEDGDALTYVVLFSENGGQDWTPLDTGLRENSYVWDTARTSGSDSALIRVIASDGVNSSQDDSDSLFSVARKSPEVAILSPEDRYTYFLNEIIALEGTGYDLEDGPLGDEFLSWSSDVDGALGTGRNVSVIKPSSGEHNMTLTAEDSDRNLNEASIIIRVSSVEDSDGDGIGDDVDNCPFIYSTDQSDLDGDGVGDVCDNDDLDSDGYPDIRDNCILITNDQADVDGDGIGDVCDEFNYHLYDRNPADWIIGDFELLDAIDAWAIGILGDFDLLDLIDYWAIGCYQWDASSSTHKAGC